METDFLGQRFSVERKGTDGDFKLAQQMISELDGQVAAIGLGGIDLYLVAGRRRYVIRDALKLARCAQRSPVVDGSGLKNTLERETIRFLHQQGLIVAADGAASRPRFLVVSAVDRFGMAEAVEAMDCETIYGDLIYALQIPIPVRRMATIRLLAASLLPVLCRLPFQMIYPTGEKQTRSKEKENKWFRWADIIGGDFHYIGSNLPDPERITYRPLAGKTIVTNTTTQADVRRLRALGLEKLISTTQRLNGRSFGTNVMEGVLVALSGKQPQDLSENDYLQLLRELAWHPQIDYLQKEADQPA